MVRVVPVNPGGEGPIETIEGFFTVLNERGLHTRPSTELARCASAFQSEIFLYYQEWKVNAKSILGILMLAANRGAKIRVEATGIDARGAVAAILDLAAGKFALPY